MMTMYIAELLPHANRNKIMHIHTFPTTSVAAAAGFGATAVGFGAASAPAILSSLSYMLIMLHFFNAGAIDLLLARSRRLGHSPKTFSIGTGSWLQMEFMRHLNLPAKEQNFAPIKRYESRRSH